MEEKPSQNGDVRSSQTSVMMGSEGPPPLPWETGYPRSKEECRRWETLEAGQSVELLRQAGRAGRARCNRARGPARLERDTRGYQRVPLVWLCCVLECARAQGGELNRVAEVAEFRGEKGHCGICGVPGQDVPGWEDWEEADACSLCVICQRDRFGEGGRLRAVLTDAWGVRILGKRATQLARGREGPREATGGGKIRLTRLVRGSVDPPLLAQARATVARSTGRVSAREVAEPLARFLCGSQQQVYRRGKYGHTNLATIARPCPKRLESRERCNFNPASRGPLSTACRGPEKVGSGSRRKGKVRAEALGCVETPRE